MNEVIKTKELSATQKFTVDLVNELDNAASQMGTGITEYGKKCFVNAVAGIVNHCKLNGIELKQLDGTQLRLQLQNIAFMELNWASIPSEVYADFRKITNEETGEVKYNLAIKPQGAGNEKLIRKYGVGIQKDTGLKSAWLVREGDDFLFPTYDGLNVIPPKWTPKSYDKKVIMVVYPLVKIDGSAEYLIATREGIKPNIIAQIRQNTQYDFKSKEERKQFYAQVDEDAENMSVDELIKKYAEQVNPTYTSGGSKEQMILRKMKNNALKNYPKEYDNTYIKEAVEAAFEDVDDTIKEKPSKVRGEELVEKVESEINEKPATTDENTPADFDVKVEEKKASEPVVEEKPKEKSKQDYGF